MAEDVGQHPGRRTFGPVVLLGLGAAGLASVAATNPWVSSGYTATQTSSAMTVTFDAGESPLAAALGLVLLAAWGVLLVTRGLFRRIVAWLGAAAAVGYAVTAVMAPWQLRGAVERSILSTEGVVVKQDLDVTAWWMVALVAAVLACVASALGVVLVRHWPEMGTKYDSPTGPRATKEQQGESVPTENIDIWKALDEGRDPTA